MNGNDFLWRGFVTCVFLSFLIGCASTGSPSGGPRDKKPPELVVEKSAPNFSTNYKPEKIELYFDEWIELKNQQREILISPPFFTKPQIKSRGKKVTVEFPVEEPLREDATYTINFGKSIVDFTEGNEAEGFRFVFATGDKIDSLEFKGQLQDAIDGSPVKDVLVLMYDILEDSVVVNEKPFYYARTDESGNFNFQNLKNDTFKVFVLEDLNFNYLLDPEIERLAFPDSLFILNDSSSYNPVLRLFEPEQRLRILDSSSETPGLVYSVFNKPAEKVDYSVLYPENASLLSEAEKDTLRLWFSEPLDSMGIVYGTDTLDFTINSFDSLFYSKKLTVANHSASSTFLAPFEELSISFSAPLSKVDTSMIQLIKQPIQIPPPGEKGEKGTKGKVGRESTEDSIQMNSDSTVVNQIDSTRKSLDTLVQDTPEGVDTLDVNNVPFQDSLVNVEIDSIGVDVDSLGIDSLGLNADTILVTYDFTDSIAMRNLFIGSNWKDGFEYRLELMPGAVTDIYGRTNDTAMVDFKTANLTEFGNIALKLSRMDSAQQYVVLLKLNEDVVRKEIIPDTTVKRIEFNRLRVNTYTVELIKDDDQNGEWTTGDYWLNRQPEELKTFTLDKLRENWDLEADIFWNEKEELSVGLDSLGIQSDSLGVRSDSLRMNRPPPGTQGQRPPPKPNPRGNDKGDPRDPRGRNE